MRIAGNYFWRTLWQVGLTPRRFAPRDFAKLRDVGIGFTDLSKSACGMDHDIAAGDFDVATFNAKMRQLQPRAIAFTSKKAASLWLRRRTDRIAYGRQKRRSADFCEVFVLPSPSSAARRYWKIEPWRDLADWLRATKPWRLSAILQVARKRSRREQKARACFAAALPSRRRRYPRR